MELQISFVLETTKFFDRYRELLDSRQEKVVARMIEAGWQGFESGINQRKYLVIAKTSTATASRDWRDLETMGALRRIGRGRNTRYELAIAPSFDSDSAV